MKNRIRSTVAALTVAATLSFGGLAAAEAVPVHHSQPVAAHVQRTTTTAPESTPVTSQPVVTPTAPVPSPVPTTAPVQPVAQSGHYPVNPSVTVNVGDYPVTYGTQDATTPAPPNTWNPPPTPVYIAPTPPDTGLGQSTVIGCETADCTG